MGELLVVLLQIGFWVFLIRIIRSAANKGKKAAEEQRKAASASSPQPAAKPAASPMHAPAPKERHGTTPRLRQDDHARRAASAAPRPTAVAADANPEPHVVEPSFGKKHAHTESSMTGFEECAPEPSHIKPAAEEETLESPELTFAGKEIIKAMLYSEILSKPKALR